MHLGGEDFHLWVMQQFMRIFQKMQRLGGEDVDLGGEDFGLWAMQHFMKIFQKKDHATVKRHTGDPEPIRCFCACMATDK